MTGLVQVIGDAVWYEGFRVAKLEPISPSLPFSEKHHFTRDLVHAFDYFFVYGSEEGCIDED